MMLHQVAAGAAERLSMGDRLPGAAVPEPDSPGSPGAPPGARTRVRQYLARQHLSIRTKILLSFAIVILMLGGTNAVLIWQVVDYSRQYDAIITNITTANSINGYIKPAIDTEMWNLVAGKTEFGAGSQYAILNDVNDKLRWMMTNSDAPEAKHKLEIILRTMKTLTHYVDVMGQQMARKSKVAENEVILENIRGVSTLVEELVGEYALFEVQIAEQRYLAMHENFTRWVTFYGALMVAAIVFSFLAAWAISRSIYTPIKKLHDVTTTITKHDLAALVNRNNVDEIAELGISFNIMIGTIRELLDEKAKEQENLKKAELRALQAQINPHFLYNTLDTIIWLAEAHKTDQVVDIVRALSSFFRLSLSKGRDWITIAEEVERTRSYLTIQKMRYRDILDYTIEIEPQAQDKTILKLILQPLVENALYHGIKNKRQGGTITVRVLQPQPDEVRLEVEDNGIGMSPVQLAQIQALLQDEGSETGGEIVGEQGFGMANVNKRVRLYYGPRYGLSIRSVAGVGTCATIVIPARCGNENGPQP
jgi:two-component system sensor histidine kinase YesM